MCIDWNNNKNDENNIVEQDQDFESEIDINEESDISVSQGTLHDNLHIYFKYLQRLHEFQLHGCFTNCPVLKKKNN